MSHGLRRSCPKDPVRRRPAPSRPLRGLVPVVILGLAGIAWAVNDAIDRHHDRIALKGLDGKPSPIALTVGSEPLVIPANLIRFPTDRRGGLVTAVDLLLHWPSLDGFSEERAKEFRDGSPQAPLVYVTITEAETPLDSTARLADIYGRYFAGPAVPGPGHLVGRYMDPAVRLSRRDRLFRAARRGTFCRPLPRRGDAGDSGDLHPRRQYRPRPDDALPLQPEHGSATGRRWTTDSGARRQFFRTA